LNPLILKTGQKPTLRATIDFGIKALLINTHVRDNLSLWISGQKAAVNYSESIQM